ncbi:MAG TPA: dephospho-CoA kinase [bacterium]|nr:dephospho-CoA kinase [bacterium]
MKRNTKVFGLTGNIGTGKSTVAWMFGELGVPVLDSDEISHSVIAPKGPAWKAIYERYGRVALSSGDAIDRKTLARIVFGDEKERRFLESVIHPHVKDEVERRVAALSKEGNPFVIVEVPLLFEVGWEKSFDAVIVVSCNEENEIRRCREKFGFDREEVLLRLAAQHPLERKIAAADAVIDNDGDLEETKVQVNRLHQEMVRGTFPGR